MSNLGFVINEESYYVNGIKNTHYKIDYYHKDSLEFSHSEALCTHEIDGFTLKENTDNKGVNCQLCNHIKKQLKL